MRICVRNAKNEILGYYEAEELSLEVVDRLKLRDFEDGYGVLAVNDEVTVPEEAMVNDQWKAGLIDRIQECGDWVSVIEGHIVVSNHKGAYAVFHNWSEVEAWLLTNN